MTALSFPPDPYTALRGETQPQNALEIGEYRICRPCPKSTQKSGIQCRPRGDIHHSEAARTQSEVRACAPAVTCGSIQTTLSAESAATNRWSCVFRLAFYPLELHTAAAYHLRIIVRPVTGDEHTTLERRDMGKGDKRTKRGKLYRGTYGKTRIQRRKKHAPAPAAAPMRTGPQG